LSCPDAPTTQLYTLSLHDALPIFPRGPRRRGDRLVAGLEDEPVGAPALRRARADAPGDVPAPGDHPGGRALRAVPEPVLRASTVDRKSTRLNSSHVKISYAVFCLK